MLDFWKKHPVIAMGVYTWIYQMCFSALERSNRPVHLVHSPLDEAIPFVPQFVVAYLGWFLWVPAVLFFFLRFLRPAFWRLFIGMMLGTSSTLLVYLVFPTGLNLREPILGKDVFSQLVRMIYSVDTSTNVCPSLHVMITLLVFLTIYDYRCVFSRVWLWCHGFVVACIIASTVLLNQHSVIDVLWGTIFALGVHLVTQKSSLFMVLFQARQQPTRALRRVR